MPNNRPALRKPFAPKAATENTIRRAKIAIRDILQMQILERHKRELISTVPLSDRPTSITHSSKSLVLVVSEVFA